MICILLLFIPQIVCADNSQTELSAKAETLPVMPTIHVEAVRIAPTTGMTIIDKEMIENLPTRNGSVNEIIGIVPGVQYSEESLSSLTGGEITPPVISISGSRFYENNYTVDGISNNSPLDPAHNSANFSISKLPGHPQTHFLSHKLIEQITVYNSNIPAEFGGFTGGQVDTTTINPTANTWGNVYFRTTSDAWTKFHINPDDKESFYNSNSSKYQPKFKKQNFGFTLNTPIDFDTSLVSSYQQINSKIELLHLDSPNTQSRKQENFFIKLRHYLANDFIITGTAIYSPTSTQSFLKDFKESDYTIEGDSYSLILQAEKKFDNNQFKLVFNYTGQNIDRNAPLNRFYWSTDTDSIDWASGKEGGSGSLQTSQDTFSIKPTLLFDTINIKKTNHTLKLGAEATYSNQKYHRPSTSYSYTGKIIDSLTICADNDPACIENEQYMSTRIMYQQAKADVEITDLAAFIQDSIVWKRLEIIPGVRISYDDFTSNLNIAPRFTTALDIFGNQSTILFAGKNRYYSGTLLTHALYSTILTVNEDRSSSLGEWGNTTNPYLFVTPYSYNNGDINTPYSDELSLGIIQKFLGSEIKIQYIEKKNKNELARSVIAAPRETPDGERIPRNTIEPDIYLFNNLGQSGYKSIQASWHKSWKNHFLEINTTWQKTTTSHDLYTDTINEEDTAETIWYEDNELYYDEIPRTDFNRPVIANFIYTCNLPYNTTFTNTTKYRGAYWKLGKSRDEDNSYIKRASVINPEQSDPYVYERVKSDSSVIFDWSFIWKTPENLNQNITFSLDILNVFNRKAKIDYETDPDNYDYELGRQIWAGLEFNF